MNIMNITMYNLFSVMNVHQSHYVLSNRGNLNKYSFKNIVHAEYRNSGSFYRYKLRKKLIIRLVCIALLSSAFIINGLDKRLACSESV